MAEYKIIDGKATSIAIKKEIAEEVERIVAAGGKRPHLLLFLLVTMVVAKPTSRTRLLPASSADLFRR